MCDSSRTGCVWRTTPVWREQADIRYARRGIFIVAWCDSGKLWALAARPFQSQQRCFDQSVKVVPGTTFTKGTCNRCGSLQKRGNVVATSPLALHWKCVFRMPNTWKWPEITSVRRGGTVPWPPSDPKNKKMYKQYAYF